MGGSGSGKSKVSGFLPYLQLAVLVPEMKLFTEKKLQKLFVS